MRRREDGVVSGDMDRVSFAARLCVSVPDKCAVFVDLDNLDPVFRFEYDYAIVSEDDEIGKALQAVIMQRTLDIDGKVLGQRRLEFLEYELLAVGHPFWSQTANHLSHDMVPFTAYLAAGHWAIRYLRLHLPASAGVAFRVCTCDLSSRKGSE